MRIVTGQYNSAKVFTDLVDEESIRQIKLLCDQEFTKGANIRMMPDVHAGAGCTVGTTMTIKDKVVPNLVGVDIGCGMETVILSEKDIDCGKLDELIHKSVPSSFQVRSSAHSFCSHIRIDDLRCAGSVNLDRALLSLGTLGGGNHFIEAGRDEHDAIYLVVHTGSRHLGLEVCGYYQKEGASRLNDKSHSITALVEEYKKSGRKAEIAEALRNFKRDAPSVPEALAWVEGEMFENYLHDMAIVQEFAHWNRQAIVDVLIDGMNFKVKDRFTTIHNYIDLDNMILRKGAVSAQRGERLLIPVNMRDGSLVCEGLGAADWNYSAPHGAGRIMSRSQASKELSLDEYAREMQGIYTTSVNIDTLDEAPMAYKPMESIVKNIADTASIITVVKPIYNFKAAEKAGPRRRK